MQVVIQKNATDDYTFVFTDGKLARLYRYQTNCLLEFDEKTKTWFESKTDFVLASLQVEHAECSNRNLQKKLLTLLENHQPKRKMPELF